MDLNNYLTIKVKDSIPSPYWGESGERLFITIEPILRKGASLILDFKDVLCTSDFFGFYIKLLNIFGLDDVSKRVKITNMPFINIRMIVELIKTHGNQEE